MTYNTIRSLLSLVWWNGLDHGTFLCIKSIHTHVVRPELTLNIPKWFVVTLNFPLWS